MKIMCKKKARQLNSLNKNVGHNNNKRLEQNNNKKILIVNKSRIKVVNSLTAEIKMVLRNRQVKTESTFSAPAMPSGSITQVIFGFSIYSWFRFQKSKVFSW